MKTSYSPSINIIDKDGKLDQSWDKYFSILDTELNYYFGTDGTLFAFRTYSDITNLLNTNSLIGRILYDSDNQVMRVNNTGQFKEILTGSIFQQLSKDEFDMLDIPNINQMFVHEKTNNKFYIIIYGNIGEISIDWVK
jgi:hypothetical protein